MTKKTKKRNKPYTGPDAATGPRVRRYSVSEKSRQQMWWQDNKKKVLTYSLLLIAALLVSWGISSLIN